MTSMLKLVKIADIFTIGNLACGMLAIFFSTEGHPAISSALLILAVVFDTLDGKVAGWLNQKNVFGKQLDSLADLVSFGVAPAFMYFSLDTHHWAKTVILIVFVTSGMLRLARYNISDGKGFEGLPITVNGVLFPALVALGSVLPDTIKAWPAVFVVQSVLMASSLTVRRLF
jgi:CDP-diacylglycerol--serine O-phosphatidyltransferase